VHQPADEGHHWGQRRYTRDGYSMTRTRAPRALGGMLFLNLAFTTPLGPCGRMTRPQMTRYFEPSFSVFACKQACEQSRVQRVNDQPLSGDMEMIVAHARTNRHSKSCMERLVGT
jgi:hypothetical protein